MPRTFAYCRVSTAEQTVENQTLEIAHAGFTIEPHRVITDTVSGSVPASQREGFKLLLNKLEHDDVLVVTKLDRLGRNAMDVRDTVDKLDKHKVRVHCLALGGVDLTSPAGRMTMGVIAAVAEFERDLLIERTHAGLDRAKAAGKHLGRPRSLTAQAEAEAKALLSSGRTVADVARTLGVSRQTIMRARALTVTPANL